MTWNKTRPFICQNPLAVLQSRAEKRAFSKCKQKLFTDRAEFTPGSGTCSPSGIVLKPADYFKYGAFPPFYQDILSTLFSCSGKYNRLWHKQYIVSYWEIFKKYIFYIYAVMHLPIKWELKHTVWVIFWYYFAWAHCDRFSWEQQFIESSQWLSPDFSLHPWQLFYLLARLLTALSVHFSSKQSDPGSDRSSRRGSTVQTPSPPLHLLAELCKGSELIRRLSDHQSQLCNTSRDAPSGDPASSWSIFTIVVHHIRCPEQHNPLLQLSGHI